MIIYQQGPADSLDRLRGVVAGCSYKPGWQFELADMDRCGEHFGAGRGWTLTIAFEAENSIAPGEPITGVHFFPVPPATWDTATWERWVLDCIIDCERHEAMEFIRFDGHATFFPAHGLNTSNPYLIERKAA